MNPGRDAGKFAYHLKFLLKADLIEADAETKKYSLTELGKVLIDVTDRVEKKTFSPRSTLVRTSRYALEEFDANRIAGSLINEAKMPPELAQRVAKEAEKRLMKSKTKYLTAPLVREVANAILIEKGLEEYRHKLTRLGLPVHEVAALLESSIKRGKGSASVYETAGKTVLTEFIMLKMLPRDVSDAHLSGQMHLDNLNSWILKPDEVIHDLRFFIQNGLNLEKTDPTLMSMTPPKNFESALATIFNVILCSAGETNATQSLEYFNVFLAPLVKNVEDERVKEILRSFILSLNQHPNLSLSLEIIVPKFIAEKPAIGSSGAVLGKYGDFVEQAQSLASAFLDAVIEESERKPFFNPKIVVKIRQEAFEDGRARALLLKAHNLACQRGMLYFANVQEKSERSVISASGLKINPDLNDDWETDTLRTGLLGCVSLNLPRIAYECNGDKNKFFGLLKERLDLAAKALEMKHKALKQNNQGLLPFLMQTANGDPYYRLEESVRLLNSVGLNEAAEAFCGKNDDETMKFAEEVTQFILEFVHKIGRGRRLYAAMLPDLEASERLARLDIEKYGVAKVRFSGSREKPRYSTVNEVLIQDQKLPVEKLKQKQALCAQFGGGTMTAVDLGQVEWKASELLSITRELVEAYDAGFFTYIRRMTYCRNCKKSFFGALHKCPVCGATGALVLFD
jgi:ribonucleoside-triphosphate reductase